MEKRSRKKARIEKSTDNQEDIESDISDDDKFSDDEEGGIRIDDIYIPPAPPPVCSYESTGPRLVITSVINENFKSYGGRVPVGPFDTSFACIIGPNGSGKSNVIDSMLFVFGYRATKIRSKKVSVLIHKSKEFPDCTSCRVEVHFAVIVDKENGDFEVVASSEFVISRTAFKNNSSFYEIDGKRVQFKEVAMLLRHHGVDLVHNRFLILQGEVEQIALMKPKGHHPNETGMLEYLEDIIGTTRYKEPIEKLQARIETLNEERQEKLNRLKVVESEREALKGPMEETVRFLQTENRITHLKNKKYQYQLHKINKIIVELQKEKEEIETEFKSLNDKLKEIQDQRGNEKSEMDSLNKTLQKMMKKHEEFSEIHQNAEKRNTGLMEEGKQLKKNRKKTVENLKTEEDKLKKLLEIPEKNQKQIEKLTEEEAELNVRRQEEEAAFQTVMSSLQQETKVFQQEKDKLQAEQIKLKKKYNDMRSAFELAKSERDIYVSTEQKEKAKLEQLVQKLNETKETLDARKNELSELQKELPAKEQSLKKAEDHLRNIKIKGEAISNDLRRYNAQLLEKKSSMSANRSRNRVTDFLMRLKTEGKIPGIFGRLGDLGGIDKKYDVAISTACSMLDFVVVDSPETSNRCIKALKEHNVGNGNFMVLSTVNRNYSADRVARYTAPPNSSRLFDLIRVNDERVRPAFYFALRDTLVANDLDLATGIAYGKTRHRVVTLNGELIEISGTMSGGGTQVMRGKMGTSVSVSTDTNTTEEVNNLESRVNALEGQMQQFREQEQECENIISRFGPEIRTMQMNANKLKIEIEGLSKQYPELKNQVQSQEKKVKECAPNENRLNELSKKVEDTEKGARKAEKEMNAIDEKVNTVHEKIMEITGGKTKEAQEKLDEVTKRWEKTRTTITQLQVAIKTSERNANKAQERIENMKIELEEAAKREAEIEEEKETVKNDCQLSMEKATKLQEEIDEKKARLGELQEEHKNFMLEVNKLKASIVKEEQKIESIDKKINDTHKDVPALQQKLEKLTLHKIPIFNEPVEEEEENEQRRDTDTPPAESDVLMAFETEAFAAMSQSDINNQLQTEEEYLKTLTPNLNTLKDYEKKTQQYIERSNELKEITERRNICRQGYEEARKNRHQEFMTGFNIISNKLKELYQMLTMGGDAELDLNDSLDPFTEGISFCVRPPKKSWKIITNLSGGEKTLSSLALVFALHYYRPTPLYVMDEIDAALDFRNVSIVGYYIKERTKNAQFIVISLRTNMFELGESLTGIYKPKNSTRSTTIRPEDLGVDRQPKDSRTGKKTTIETTQARARPAVTERRTVPAPVSNERSFTTVVTATVHEEPRTEPTTVSRSRRSATGVTAIVQEEPRSQPTSASSSPTENSNIRKRKRSQEDLNRIDTEPDSEEETPPVTAGQKVNAPVSDHDDSNLNEIVPDANDDLSAIDQDSDEEEILNELMARKRQEKQVQGNGDAVDNNETIDSVSSGDINLLSEIQARRRANKE